jgi:hypothetical protein
MLFLFNELQDQINMAPPQFVRSEFQNVKTRQNQANMKINTLQTGLGTLGQDLSTAKSKIPQNPVPALTKIITDLQSISAQLVDAKDSIQNNSNAQLQFAAQLNQVASDLVKVDNRSKDTDQDLSNVDKIQRDLLNQTNNLVNEVRSIENTNNNQINSLTAQLHNESIKNNQLGLALSKNIFLVAEDAENISAALLNAAVAGSFTKDTIFQLASKEIIDEEDIYTTHPWASFAPVVDSAIGEDKSYSKPTIEMTGDPSADIMFNQGLLSLTTIFDTDAGLTKIYTVGDVITDIVKVSIDDTLLGVTVVSVVKTYNVVA